MTWFVLLVISLVLEWLRNTQRRLNLLTRISSLLWAVHCEVVPIDFVDKNIDYILWANGIATLVEMAKQYPNIEIEKLEGIYQEGRKKPKLIEGNLLHPDRQITEKYRANYNYIYHNNCATIKMSFGCPYKCNFCFCTQITNYSTRDIDDVLDELEEIKEDNVFIVDDNFWFAVIDSSLFVKA